MNPRPVVPPIEIGVIGLGRRGLFHLERWFDGSAVRVAAACDRDPGARAAAATLCGRVSADPGSLLADPTIDAVLLAVPVAERAALGRLVQAAGKRLVVADPPVAATVGEAAALNAAAADAGRPILVSAPWREEPGFRAALAVARSGAAGRMRFLRFERWEPAAAAPGGTGAGGELPRSLVYVLDQLVALAATPAVRVHATGCPVEAMTVAVRFRDGLHASVLLHADAAVRVDHGWAWDGERGGYAAGRRWVRTADGEVYDVPAEPPPAAAFEDVLRSALAGGEPPVTSIESLRLVALLTAVARAFRSGEVVEAEPVP
ncbi:MAG TPA: Gfo/Idh/MocA family oxidoreductase [Planctomycetaceae bacterium]